MATALISLSRLAAPGEPPQGTRIADARRAMAYWSQRSEALPWRRRSARREARKMLATARAQLIGAHLERFGLSTFERAVTPLLDTGGRGGGAHIRFVTLSVVRRTALGRRILLGAAAVTVGSIAIVAVVAALATHLIAL